MTVLLYLKNGEFFGLGETAGYIMLRGDHDETFWLYGSFDVKETIPNTFTYLAFDSHANDPLDNDFVSSKKIFFLPSTTDRKETLNIDRVTPINCKIDDFNMFTPKDFPVEGYRLDPTHLVPYKAKQPQFVCNNLNSTRKTLYTYLTYVIDESNTNLQKNATDLLQSKSLTKNDIHWLIDISIIKCPFSIGIEK